MPACDLSALVRSSTNCKYTPAGVKDRIYIFDIDELPRPIPEPMANGFFNPGMFTGVQFFAIDIKTDSGKVTSEKSEDSEARTLTATAVIDYSLEKFLPIDAAIAFRNVGVVVPIDNEKAYCVMSSYRRTKYTSNYDSGDTYDSEHGFTISFVCSPVLYACPLIDISASGINIEAVATTQFNDSYGGSGESVSIQLDKTNLNLSVGAKETLVATGPSMVWWSSTDTNVVSVNTSGVVTATGRGYAIVYASYGSSKVGCAVTVS